jgi:hypothetical protein
MLGETVAALKLLLDKDTRALVRDTRDAFQQLPDQLSTDSTKWRKHLTRVADRFRRDQEAEAAAFISYVLATVHRQREDNAGTPTGKLFFEWWNSDCSERLRVVLSELVANAFTHAIKRRRFGACRVNVILSPWFVRVDVVDNGPGFSLSDALAPRPDVAHGIHVVSRAATKLFTNRKGNHVTAIIDPSIGKYHLVSSLDYRGQDIIFVHLERTEVSLYSSDWTPVVRLLKEVRRPRVVIDCTTFYWNTRESWGARQAVEEMQSEPSTRVAVVVSPTMLSLFSLETLSNETVRVFDCKYTYKDSDLGLASESRDKVEDELQVETLVPELELALQGFKEALDWLTQASDG